MICSCSGNKEHTAPAILERDSVSMMVSYGVNNLISDSGVMRYRVIAEKWEINTVRNPSRWIFEQGVFLQQYDEQFRTLAYLQCDTAYYFDQKKLWELHGRVRYLSVDGIRFTSEELFWDQEAHEMWSNRFSRIVTPEREMQGNRFSGDERMTHYSVTKAKGSFERGAGGLTGGGPSYGRMPQPAQQDSVVRDSANNTKKQ